MKKSKTLSIVKNSKKSFAKKIFKQKKTPNTNNSYLSKKNDEKNNNHYNKENLSSTNSTPLPSLTFNKESSNIDDPNYSSTIQFFKLEDLLLFLKKRASSAINIMKQFKIAGKHEQKVIKELDKLVSKGIFVKLSSNLYKLPKETIKNTNIPKTALLTITNINKLGEAQAKFSEPFANKSLNQYNIFLEKLKKPVFINDKIIASMKKVNKKVLTANILKYLPASKYETIIGLIQEGESSFYLLPLSRKYKFNFNINLKDFKVSHNTLVEAVITSLDPRPTADIIKVISEKDLSKELSTLTIYEFNLPNEFSKEVQDEASKCLAPTLNNKVDLRNIPLVTIDGEDAKDFDDAVWAEAIDNRKNCFRAIIAIADVSSYVKPNSALDKEAQNRGNSTYLPGKVIPMLPEVLSNGWCSLNPNEDRATVVADVIINEQGELEKYKFYEALINSKARLTYNEVENAISGTEISNNIKPVLNTTIKPLFECWKVLNNAKLKRGALEINSKEFKVEFNEDNSVKDIIEKSTLTANKIIEELMITANVAAAKFLKERGFAKQQIVIYRVHDKPSSRKIENLTSMLKSLGIKTPIPKDLSAKFFNDLLKEYQNNKFIFRMLNEIALSSQSQAIYTTNNIGHFGLELKEYCHFTSPIRRYADLHIHRLIKQALNKEETNFDAASIASLAEHLSVTERTAQHAEFAAIEKIIAKLMQEQINKKFKAYIASITNSGLFINIDKFGASGLVPMRTLGDERFVFIADEQKLIGQKSKKTFKAGQNIDVILTETNPLKGLLTFNLA